ncbi:MAG: PaaI family thioesterase [Flammeovirgaceae bacterium]
MEKVYFQDFMKGNVCFGCGTENPDGLQIKSFWDGDEAVCIWESEEKYHGWKGLMNGGILATLIDCHCMGTAMAASYRHEGRDLASEPVYKYATGTITVKYLKPTPNDKPIELRAKVLEVKGRKVTLTCTSIIDGIVTAEADVIAIRVFDSSLTENIDEFSK